MKWIAFSGVLLILLVVLAVFLAMQGGNAVSATPFVVLSSVPAPEMPAKAAELVSAASAPDRGQTAEEVLRAVSTMTRPGVLPYVVSAICRSHPELAGLVVAKAIELEPDDILNLCKAAIYAAPDQVAGVVTAACKADPPSFANVAVAVSRQLPYANNLILAGLVRAIPGLDPYLEQAEIREGTNDFEALIKQTVQLVTDPAQAQAK